MEFQFFYFSHVYVTTASAGRHNVLLCEVSHQIMRHNTWLQGQYLQNYPMMAKNASYARSPSLYCYLSGTLAVCNFSLARAKLYWTLCLEHFDAKAIENGGGGSYYGAGGRLSGQTGRYYYNWQLAKMKKFDSNVMANFDPFHGNWRIQLLISTHTLFWAWLTFETIELDQIRLNLD